jgi:hypothetical protein
VRKPLYLKIQTGQELYPIKIDKIETVKQGKEKRKIFTATVIRNPEPDSDLPCDQLQDPDPHRDRLQDLDPH